MAIVPVPKAVPTGTKRAAIYTRVSTDEQADKGTSLETQRQLCQQLAESQGFTVTAIYEDVESGGKLNRKQFNAMLASVERREVEAVICLTPDRLARNMNHQAYAIVTAERSGVAMLFVQSPPATTLEGRILEMVRGMQAEIERVDIAKRTQSGLRQRVKNGGYLPGNKPPYGYQWAEAGPDERPKSRLELDPLTAPIAARMFEHIAAGQSTRKLEIALTEERIPTPSEYAKGLPASKHWSASSISLIIRNPVYKGEPQAYRWKMARPDQATVEVPLDPITEPIALPKGVAPELVSPELWQRANDRLDRNKREATRRNANPEATLLRAGYAVCGYCGHPLIAAKARRGHEYRCSAGNRWRNGCPRFGMSAKRLDEAVWGRVMDVLTDPAYVRQYMQTWLEGEDTTAVQLARVDAELVSIENKERKLAANLALLDDPAPVVKMLNDLAARKGVLMLEQNHLALRRATYEQTLERWDTMLKRWQWLNHPKLTQMSYADKRFWLANLNVKAEVWRRDGGPDGQHYRITMAIDESFWLPDDDELDGSWLDDLARLEAGHGLRKSATVNTSAHRCSGPASPEVALPPVRPTRKCSQAGRN